VKKTLILALIAVFAVAGMAFAENRVEVKVTSEPIQYHAECEKAGGFTLEFDEGTEIMEGDIITIDLDYGAKICKTVDIEISAGGAGTEWTAANIPATGAPFIDPNDSAITIGGGIFIRLFGAAGSARLTLTVMSNVDEVAGNDGIGINDNTPQADKLILYFLDQQVCNDFFNQEGIYIDPDENNVYDVCIDDIQYNTLCIDISNYDAYTVNGNMDSKLDKFTFIPSNPQIAHVVDPVNYQMVECKGALTDRISVGEVTQQGPGCPAFDWDDDYGYCSLEHNNKLLIDTAQPGMFWDAGEYQIQIEILTDGVYWTNQAIAAEGYGSAIQACAADLTNSVFGTPANYAYTNPTLPPIAVSNLDCDPVGPQTVTTDCAVIAGPANMKVVNINIPALKYNIEQIILGQHVEVQITLIKCPCGEVNTWTVDLGALGCDDDGDGGAATSLLFPYYTSCEDGAADPFWDGFVVTNLGNQAGEAIIYCYESDGDSAQMTVSVPAHGMYVATTSAMMNAPVGGQVVSAMTQTGGTGTWGDDRCYMVVCTDFSSDGFAFMGRSSDAGAKGESMGYLPRDNKSLCPGVN